MSLIDLDNIHRVMRLPDDSMLTVLEGITMSVDAGEHVAIVGRSGSGKSTLLNLIGLLDTPTVGVYHLDGTDTARLGGGRRSRLRGQMFGFIFQQFNLLDGLTAAENVAAPLLYGGGKQFWSRDRLAREMLDRVGLSHRADSLPDRLSGGEQQRVAIARALVRQPRVVLADEPTGALDVETGRAVMDLMESLVHDNDATLLTITHDPAVAARADRQVRLDHGRVVGAASGPGDAPPPGSAPPGDAEPPDVAPDEGRLRPGDAADAEDDTLVTALLGPDDDLEAQR